MNKEAPAADEDIEEKMEMAPILPPPRPRPISLPRAAEQTKFLGVL